MARQIMMKFVVIFFNNSLFGNTLFNNTFRYRCQHYSAANTERSYEYSVHTTVSIILFIKRKCTYIIILEKYTVPL